MSRFSQRRIRFIVLLLRGRYLLRVIAYVLSPRVYDHDETKTTSKNKKKKKTMAFRLLGIIIRGNDEDIL